MVKKILITGASGFIGSNLAIALSRLSPTVEIYGLSRTPPNPSVLRHSKKFQWHETNLENTSQVMSLLSEIRPDVVVHAAAAGVDFRFKAQIDSHILSQNVIASSQLLTIASQCGVSEFIALGSCLEYGLLQEPARETFVPNPLTLYGASKAASTILLREQGRSLGVPTCVLRLFGVWGAFENTKRLFPQVIRSCQAGTPLLLSPGDQIRDYSYAGDVARKLAELSLGRIAFPEDQVINFASGRPRIVRDLVLEWASHFKGDHLMKFDSFPYRSSESTLIAANVELAKHFDLVIDETPMDEALEDVKLLETKIG